MVFKSSSANTSMLIFTCHPLSDPAITAATTNALPGVTGMYRDIFYFSSCQERWYKSTMRREKIAMLMQGLTLPNPRPCISSSLPPTMERPFSPPPSPVEPFEFFWACRYVWASSCTSESKWQHELHTTTTFCLPIVYHQHELHTITSFHHHLSNVGTI